MQKKIITAQLIKINKFSLIYIILVLIILLFSTTANASIWDAIGACFTDPCNCGDSNSTRYENWNGQVNINKGKKNRNCPPYNKTSGRNNNTCLVKAAFPGRFIGYYENLCAETSPSSDYFKPKIRIRGQQCNFAACWTTSNDLAWNGQCVTLASGYGIPLHRMCARIAVPANTKTGTPQDPGYTPGVHLNYEGATIEDDPVYGYDGQPITFNPPKLCAYYDPAFFDMWTGTIDILDVSPTKQSFHKTTQIHPIVKIIIFFADMATQGAQSMAQMIGSLYTSLGGGDNSTLGKVLQDLFKFLDILIRALGDLVISTLRAIGRINNAVHSTSYGCVNIPMGPYPPPYGPTLVFSDIASTQAICQKDTNGVTIDSTQEDPCVVSSLTNNVVRNSIRISFQNYVPLCRHGEDPTTTDKCVNIDNLGAFAAPSVIHLSTAQTDVIPACASAPNGTLCVNTMIPHRCSVSAHGCQDGFRIVYGIKTGTDVTPQDYYVTDIPDCPSNSTINCQQIWGINTSEFVDVSLIFPQIQDQSTIGSILTTDVSLNDKLNNPNVFTVSIAIKTQIDQNNESTQDPTQICAYQGTDIGIIGCENRAPLTKTIVTDCSDPRGTGVVCTSTDDNLYFRPQFIATITDGTSNNPDSTSTLVTPLSTRTNGSSTLYDKINLAGYNFDSFVTDINFIEAPFSGPRSPNPQTLIGYWKNNILPINQDMSVNPNALYHVLGLEYINNQYNLGGTKVCLKNVDTEKCPKNQNNCVLARLDNATIIRCYDDFVVRGLQAYPGLVQCTSAQANSCSVVQTITGTGGNATIYSCASTVTSYCYVSSGGVSLCQISNNPTRRIDPSQSLGAPLSTSSYYHYDESNPPNYDRNIYGIRDKTSFELNLCIDIPQPRCAAITTYDAANGFASWPETQIEQVAIGTCQSGLTYPGGVIQRRCIANPDGSETVIFEPLNQNVRCQNINNSP